jgi:anti-sigma regulatory factor (Ser/Thr protein kinase)
VTVAPYLSIARDDRLELNFSSKLEHVDRAVADLRAFCGQHCATLDDFGLRIVLHEVLTNAVVHGNQRDEGKRVRVEAKISEYMIVLLVQDEGEGVALAEASAGESDAAKSGELPTSGRGLLLLRAYCEVVSFEDDGCTVRIEKRLTRASSNPPRDL